MRSVIPTALPPQSVQRNGEGSPKTNSAPGQISGNKGRIGSPICSGDWPQVGSHLQPCHGHRVTAQGEELPTSSNTSHENTAKTKKIINPAPCEQTSCYEVPVSAVLKAFAFITLIIFSQMRKMGAKRGTGAGWHLVERGTGIFCPRDKAGGHVLGGTVLETTSEHLGLGFTLHPALFLPDLHHA